MRHWRRCLLSAALLLPSTSDSTPLPSLEIVEIRFSKLSESVPNGLRRKQFGPLRKTLHIMEKTAPSYDHEREGLRLPSTPACTLTAEQEVGPYYIPYENVRRGITQGRPDVPLGLRIALVDAKRCGPLQNAAIDICHCDAVGLYSGFTAHSVS